MECKIGEIFERNGEWYQCVEGNGCRRCDLHEHNLSASQCDNKSYCLASKRKDKTSVIFKKLIGRDLTWEDNPVELKEE